MKEELFNGDFFIQGNAFSILFTPELYVRDKAKLEILLDVK